MSKPRPMYGNVRSKIGHSNLYKDSCRLRSLNPRNVIRFKNKEEMISLGYRKCKHCWPKDETTT
jgi:methylphosphotriester-DNA--protein-cysteine methyltransferase